MADTVRRFGQGRGVRPDLRMQGYFGAGGHGPNLQKVGVAQGGDAAQATNLPQVNEQRRRQAVQFHLRQQIMPTGQNSGSRVRLQ